MKTVSLSKSNIIRSLKTLVDLVKLFLNNKIGVGCISTHIELKFCRVISIALQ